MIKKAPIDFKNKHSKNNFNYYCEHCGHTITFYAFESDKKVCNFCGKLNYKNERAKFKDNLIKKIKEVNK